MGGGGLLVVAGMHVASRAAPRQPHSHTCSCSRVGHAGARPTRPQGPAHLAQAAAETRSHEGHKGHRATPPPRFSLHVDLVRLESRSQAQITHPLVHSSTTPWIHDPCVGVWLLPSQATETATMFRAHKPSSPSHLPVLGAWYRGEHAPFWVTSLHRETVPVVTPNMPSLVKPCHKPGT